MSRYDGNVGKSKKKKEENLDAYCNRILLIIQDFSVSYFQCTGQNPNFQAGDAPDLRKSYVNLDTVFNVADEMQVRIDRK